MNQFSIVLLARRINARKISTLSPRGWLHLLALIAICGALPARGERVTKEQIDPERELVITAPAIVDSATAQYPGAWSFGTLIDQLVGPERAGQCVRDWLETWNQKESINGQDTAPRYGIYDKVIRPWQARDGYQPDPAKPWIPQMAHAPFRLLAIVNRMDLCAPAVAGSFEEVQEVWRSRGREKEFLKLISESGSDIVVGSPAASFGYGSFAAPQLVKTKAAGTAGEGRLVFCAIDETGAPLAGGWTVIFEYNLAIAPSATGVRTCAQAWHHLGSLELADPAFSDALEKLTRSFTDAGQASLAHLRTGEAAFGDGREFRQFVKVGNDLKPDALTLTPGPAFAKKHSPEERALDQFLHEQEPLIRSGIERMPDHLPLRNTSLPLTGGSAVIPPNVPNFYWAMPEPVSREGRHLFSLATCTGCHGGETGCAGGQHIHPRAEGAEAVLSSFLGLNEQTLRLDDPDVKGSKIEYNEIGDRAAILAALLEPSDRTTLNALRPILRTRLSRVH